MLGFEQLCAPKIYEDHAEKKRKKDQYNENGWNWTRKKIKNKVGILQE